MEHQKKIIAGSIIIAIFVLLVSISSWYVWNEIYFGNVCSCAVPLPILLPLLASIGLLVGTLVYYTFSPNPGRPDMTPALAFLNSPEMELVKALAENSGELSQARLSSLTGLSKVSTFRALEKLRERGVIEKERKGKTNMIKLSKGISSLFR